MGGVTPVQQVLNGVTPYIFYPRFLSDVFQLKVTAAAEN